MGCGPRTWTLVAVGLLSCTGACRLESPAGTLPGDVASEVTTDVAAGADACGPPLAGVAAGQPYELCQLPADGGPSQAELGAVVVAWFVDSASTNFDGVAFDIYCDGSGARRTLPARSHLDAGTAAATYYPAGTPGFLACLSTLKAVGDVSALQTDKTQCPKSISFGTTTTIWFDGQWSPDLQCPHSCDGPVQAVLAACPGV